MSYQRYIFITIIYILDIFMVYIVVYVNFHWLSIFFKDCLREHDIMMRTHKFLSCHGKKTDSSGIRLFCSNQEQRFAVHVRLSLTGSVSWGYLRDECLKALTLVSPILQKNGVYL